MPAPNFEYSDYPNLTSDQQKLLLNALQSNDRRSAEVRNASQSPSDDKIFRTISNGQSVGQGVNPHALDKLNSPNSPNGFVSFRRPTFGDSFLPDFTNGREADFDVDLPRGVADSLSSFAHGEYGEKRKSFEDAEEDGGDLKRGESDERTPKKPGRKPVTAEPTTKRKAQNRAAQRAFRDRKEQHLKDLENKIDDLQSASSSANQQNSLLKAQVFRLQTELRDYKKRLSSSGGMLGGSTSNVGFEQYQANGPTNNPFDFSFGTDASFTNFASLPVQDGQSKTPSRSLSDPFTAEVKRESSSRSNSDGFEFGTSMTSQNKNQGRSQNSIQSLSLGSQANGLDSNTAGDLFTPGFFGVNSSNGYGFPQFGSPGPLQDPVVPQSRQQSRSESEQAPSLISSHGDSPSSSSVSRHGPSSSCGTSPEPNNDYSKSNQVSQRQDPFGDLSQFQFNPDPSLFGDYREPQTNIFGDGDFSGGLYDDWLTMPGDTNIDINDPLNTAPAPAPTKANLMDEVAKHREAADDYDDPPMFPLIPPKQKEQREMMTCHKIWAQLKNCPKFQQGDIDMDNLCSELQTKATCTESGASITKDEWQKALWKIAGVGGAEAGDKTQTQQATVNGRG